MLSYLITSLSTFLFFVYWDFRVRLKILNKVHHNITFNYLQFNSCFYRLQSQHTNYTSCNQEDHLYRDSSRNQQYHYDACASIISSSKACDSSITSDKTTIFGYTWNIVRIRKYHLSCSTFISTTMFMSKGISRSADKAFSFNLIMMIQICHIQMKATIPSLLHVISYTQQNDKKLAANIQLFNGFQMLAFTNTGYPLQ